MDTDRFLGEQVQGVYTFIKHSLDEWLNWSMQHFTEKGEVLHRPVETTSPVGSEQPGNQVPAAPIIGVADRS